MKASLHGSLAVAGVIACLGAGVPAAVATGKATEAPSVDACLRAVDAIGARMGEAEALGGDTPAFRFIVRSNGLDYDVVCDPATGVVKDVARRLGPEQGADGEAESN